jgi:preprotein translocase subunit SecD
MSKLKKIFSNFRVILLMVALLLAIVSINPDPWREGVTIRSVASNSSANIAGIMNPAASLTPMAKERILEINDKPILDESDYEKITANLIINSTMKIKTDQKTYYMIIQPNIETKVLPELIPKEIIEEVTDPVTNETKNVTKTIYVNKTISNITGPKEIGLEVYNSPTTNIRKGLDLQGGTRVLLAPEIELSPDNMTQLIDNMKQRLNVYGLSDIIVTQANDMPVYLGGSGKQYVLIEIAGASKQEVTNLLSKQGKFEAKVGDESVFIGGRDITFVCRDATCSGIDPQAGCQQISSGEWMCRFRFSIALTPEAAQKQADVTSKLDVVSENGQEYLSKSLELYLDDAKVDELRIGADLKGRAVTDIQISGAGSGRVQQEAMTNALEQMKRLQTVLKTGSLPIKLEVTNIEAISPTLGQEFIKNSIMVGLLAILAVGITVGLRYRKIKIIFPMMATMISEVTLLIGMAALIGWNLDLAAIAGIIIAVGTGVDNLIVITDEILSGETAGETAHSWKERIKEAFTIIFGAFATTAVAMVPLLFAGAGMLKGFAITTLLGASFGVFIARPAYAAVAEILLKEE